MIQTSKTSIVYNDPNKIIGLQPFIYRWRTCDTNLSGMSPADQYQRLKLIQNTVRVYASLYTANLGSLTAYQRPTVATHGVCWNQMSDRPFPSVQKATIPTGYATSMNRRHTSVTSSKPGCQTPGGVGCDIKHNSYDRYLNRLKGRGPLRRGVVPPAFGAPIPFNVALPVYGGKTMKTSIVNNCDCPLSESNISGSTTTPRQNFEQNLRIYNDPLWQPDPTPGNITFNVGDYVYAMQAGEQGFYSRAIVLSISDDGVYTVQFDDGVIQTVPNADQLRLYFPCNCDSATANSNQQQTFYTAYSVVNGLQCNLSLAELEGLPAL